MLCFAPHSLLFLVWFFSLIVVDKQKEKEESQQISAEAEEVAKVLRNNEVVNHWNSYDYQHFHADEELKSIANSVLSLELPEPTPRKNKVRVINGDVIQYELTFDSPSSKLIQRELHRVLLERMNRLG